jgi:hypothetical protein
VVKPPTALKRQADELTKRARELTQRDRAQKSVERVKRTQKQYSDAVVTQAELQRKLASDGTPK